METSIIDKKIKNITQQFENIKQGLLTEIDDNEITLDHTHTTQETKNSLDLLLSKYHFLHALQRIKWIKTHEITRKNIEYLADTLDRIPYVLTYSDVVTKNINNKEFTTTFTEDTFEENWVRAGSEKEFYRRHIIIENAMRTIAAYMRQIIEWKEMNITLENVISALEYAITTMQSYENIPHKHFQEFRVFLNAHTHNLPPEEKNTAYDWPSGSFSLPFIELDALLFGKFIGEQYFKRFTDPKKFVLYEIHERDRVKNIINNSEYSIAHITQTQQITAEHRQSITTILEQYKTLKKTHMKMIMPFIQWAWVNTETRGWHSQLEQYLDRFIQWIDHFISYIQKTWHMETN